MSGSDSGGGGIGRREVAVRCFAAEYDDASLEYSESDEERAPNYVVTPTGARVNRLFVVGVLTEVEQVSDDVLRGRVVDPTGAFVVYAGQYQPDAKTFLERAEPPQFVAVTGKARTFEPDDADRVYTSVRPESINAVDSDTRDRWTVQTAEQTLDRVATFAAALQREERGDALGAALAESGLDSALAAGIPRAIEHYGTSEAYLAAVREMALSAAEVVAGERDEVEPLSLAPDEGGSTDVDLTGGIEIEADAATAVPASAEAPAGSAGGNEPSTETVEATAEAATGGAGTGAGTESGAEPAAVEGTGSGNETESGEDAESVDEPEAEDDIEAGDGPEPEPETAPGAGVEESTAAGGSAGEEPAGEPSPETATGAEGGEGDAREGAAGDDELGDFDEFGADAEDGADAGSGTAEAPDVATDEMYEMDDEEREAVEEEFGTEFSTGSEIEEPGEADIGTPGAAAGGDEEAEPEPVAEGSSGDEAESVSTAAPAAPEDEPAAPGDEAGFETSEAEGQTDADGADADATDEAEGASDKAAGGGDDEVDLQDAVVDAMDDLDEGEGAGREAVIEAVVDEHGVDRGAVEDAIQDALMGGRCYEPEDGRLKAI